MRDLEDMAENGIHQEGEEEEEGLFDKELPEVEGLFDALKALVAQIVDPTQCEGMGVIERTKQAFKENTPRIKHSARNSTHNLMHWMHQGGLWRAFLVISVGMILLLSLTGLGAFMLIFLAATTNTIIVGFLMSLAAVGGFMVLFFTCLTAIYVGALSIAAFVISVTTLITITAVAVVAGWIGFFWLVFEAIRKGLGFTRSSFMMTTSAIVAMAGNRPGQNTNFKQSY